VTYQITLDPYDPEIVVKGKPLGRTRIIDSRSALYPFTAAERVALRDVEHVRHIDILTQRIGSCTGNMMTGVLGTSPVFDALPASHPVLDEHEAETLYSSATHLDPYPGAYPPTDTGSDGLSVMKAAQKFGMISGYLHALTLNDVLQALLTTAVGLGSDWYDSMDQPDSSGLVTISPSAVIRGGHEYEARRIDAGRQRVGCDQSWGESWGDAGSFWLSFDTLDRLLSAGGDCVVPVPLSSPAPTPAPPEPDVDPVHKYVTDQRLIDWSNKRHARENAYAAGRFALLRAQVLD
jgi:hypothetical protein